MKLGFKELLFAIMIGIATFSIGFMSGSDAQLKGIVDKCRHSPYLVNLEHTIYTCKKFVDIRRTTK